MFSNMFSRGQAQKPPVEPQPGNKVWPEIMGVTDAAEYIGVSVEDVVQMCSSGELKAKKIGSQYRLSKSAIDEFMKS